MSRPDAVPPSSLLRPREPVTARLTRYWRDGGPWGWLNAMAVSVSLVLVLGLISLLVVGSLSHFWPSRLVEVELTTQPGQSVTALKTTRGEPAADNRHLLGELMHEELRPSAADTGDQQRERQSQRWWLLQTSSQDGASASWQWLPDTLMENIRFPRQALMLEMRDGRVLYGMARALSDPLTGELDHSPQLSSDSAVPGAPTPSLHQNAEALHARLAALEGQRRQLAALRADSEALSARLLALQQQLSARQGPVTTQDEADASLNAELETTREALITREGQLLALRGALDAGQLLLGGNGGHEGRIALNDIRHVWQPNAMGFGGRLLLTLERFRDFVSGSPNEGSGGIWPAIFGTVLMVVLMAILVMPFGVMAALYLHEVAHQGRLTRLTRIALRNLAGVPSIVYGVFGLGFFVYGLGAGLDELFFSERLPTPTFGTGGLLWASLTLALLTLPVVIVATEEGLARVPHRLREGALALGATRFETLRRVVIPAASPALMTGLILAVARAAGEVAPLMLVGVVKLAPDLPLDDSFPWLHLDRKFMHLGHQVYDLAFQSSDAFSSRPLVYATALVLVVVILCLNLSAIRLRHMLAQRYKGATE
ncbi:phosphate ABC transporter permease PstA [Cobetia marina]|uniref:phosphate ABC transporter permease PstA n=1 Tax=Cobetia marina TaxID=28258 RepID=UPI0010AEAF94|nr:phosphate ABC transporter permease PstA [Cobetia marina]TKD61233.1 phosphate ABC transporter permease PstA [Cobetia marina]